MVLESKTNPGIYLHALLDMDHPSAPFYCGPNESLRSSHKFRLANEVICQCGSQQYTPGPANEPVQWKLKHSRLAARTQRGADATQLHLYRRNVTPSMQANMRAEEETKVAKAKEEHEAAKATAMAVEVVKAVREREAAQAAMFTEVFKAKEEHEAAKATTMAANAVEASRLPRL